MGVNASYSIHKICIQKKLTDYNQSAFYASIMY